MKERPILFSAPMVRAILDGIKTQTRRVIKPQPCENVVLSGSYERPCPHGVPGDQLWVRETWCPLERCDWIGTDRKDNVNYRADCSPTSESIREEMGYAWRSPVYMPRWASRITLEITGICVQRVQEITESDAAAEGIVRIGRSAYLHGLMDGYGIAGTPPDETFTVRRNAFGHLWNSINAKRGFDWDRNPFVWAITFRRLKPKGRTPC